MQSILPEKNPDERIINILLSCEEGNLQITTNNRTHTLHTLDGCLSLCLGCDRIATRFLQTSEPQKRPRFDPGVPSPGQGQRTFVSFPGILLPAQHSIGPAQVGQHPGLI